MSNAIALVVLSAIVSIFTLAAIGGNDVANSQGTAVGSGALSLRGAQIIAGLCEFAGAALVGSAVSSTIGSKMVVTENISDLQYCWGMFSGLLSVGVWMIIATKIKMPVSATHSIIGSLFGLNLVITNFDFNSIDWNILGKIAIAWIVTPLLSFVGSFFSLIILNKCWPDNYDKDKYLYESQSLIDANDNDIDTPRSSLLSFVMAPPNPKLTPIPTPSPKRHGTQTQKIRLTWAKANENENDNNNSKFKFNNNDSEYKFEPQPFKFALVFGILMGTLVVFIMIGGPKSINIEDGNIKVDDWIIVVISFGSLILFTIIGYFIEGCYRRKYIKYIYNKQPLKSKKNDNNKYESIQMVENNNNTAGRKSQEIIDKNITPISPESKSNSESTLTKRKRLVSGEHTPSIDGTDEMKTNINENELEIENDIGNINENNKRNSSHDLIYDYDNNFNNGDYFRLYLIIASGAVAFGHGGNDVANVLGPFGQIYKYATTGTIEGEQEIPIYVAGGAGIAIAIGFALFGKPVLETIGKSITKLSYRSGFTAQFCAAATVLVCNVLGLPVSSSTVIVGGVSGVGYYNSKYNKKLKNERDKNKNIENDVEYIGCINKIKYLWQQQNIRILCKILVIWIITIPANAFMCGGLYAIINLFL